MIICLGEALIDMIPIDVSDSISYTPKVGGAIYNTAVALGRLEVDVGFMGAVSGDVFGQMIEKNLIDSSIKTDYCVTCDRLTTLAFVQLDGIKANYTFYNENASNKNLAFSELKPLPNNTKALQFGGILLMQEPSGSTIEKYITTYHEQTVIAFDPNIRGDFISDKQQYLKRFNKLLPMCDIVKISDDDLSWICEKDTQEEHSQIIDKWLGMGVKIVFLTKGEEGTTVKTKNHSIHIEAVKTKAVDTVGAGDTFNAGVLYALSEHLNKQELHNIDIETLEKATKFANKVASLSVAKQGANPPFLKEVGLV